MDGHKMFGSPGSCLSLSSTVLFETSPITSEVIMLEASLHRETCVTILGLKNTQTNKNPAHD